MSTSRIVLALLAVVLSMTTSTAQDAGVANVSDDPVITAVATGDRVRFTAPDGAGAIRVQILTEYGVPFFDSSWREGNVLDWSAEPSQPLRSGRYRCVVLVRDLGGRVRRREKRFAAHEGQVSFEREEPGGREPDPITMLAHDGTTGTIVSTEGDLSFRFGNFLAGRETERMRLTATGWLGIGTDKPRAMLEVKGLIASQGIVFPDGTILSSEEGRLTATRPASEPAAGRPDDVTGPGVSAPVRVPALPPVHLPARAPNTAARKLEPRPAFAPDYQFQTTATGVKVGTTNPDYKLDVTGTINTATEYQIDGVPVLGVFGTDSSSTHVGVGAGSGGGNNSYFGYYAGYAATGAENSFFGILAGQNTTTGSANSFFGSVSGYYNITGAGNSFFGDNTGRSLTSGFYNTALGHYADVTTGVDRSTAIGAYAKTAQNDTVILGSISGINFATTTASTGIATQTPNQYLTVGGGITVDQKETNNGTLLLNSVLAFGVTQPNNISGEAIGSQRTESGGNRWGLDFYTNYTKRVSITNGGRFEVAAGGTTLADAWTTRSSARFKDNVQPIDSPLEKTERLRGVSFDYKDSGVHSLGFIAEEVERVLPEAVQRDANGEVAGLDYDRVTPLLLEAVKAQQKRIASLEERLRKLELESKPRR